MCVHCAVREIELVPDLVSRRLRIHSASRSTAQTRLSKTKKKRFRLFFCFFFFLICFGFGLFGFPPRLLCFSLEVTTPEQHSLAVNEGKKEEKEQIGRRSSSAKVGGYRRNLKESVACRFAISHRHRCHSNGGKKSTSGVAEGGWGMTSKNKTGWGLCCRCALLLLSSSTAAACPVSFFSSLLARAFLIDWNTDGDDDETALHCQL